MNYFDDLNQKISDVFTYTPMTDEEYQISCVNDVAEWAEQISGEWNGKFPGRLEYRAEQANNIIEKCNELKELIEELANL